MKTQTKKTNKIEVAKCFTSKQVMVALLKANSKKGELVTQREWTSIFGLKSSATVRHILNGKFSFSYSMLQGLFSTCKYSAKEKEYLKVIASISNKAPLAIRKKILKAFV